MVDALRISLLSAEKIRQISCGEVVRPETINVSTHEPVDGGLFCEKIFGPARPHARDRRRRFGHIELAYPVVHIWFRKAIATLLGIPSQTLDDIVECNTFVVLEAGNTGLKPRQLLTPKEFYEIKDTDKRGFRAETGGVAIKAMLERLDVAALVDRLAKAQSSRRVDKRLQLARQLLKSGTNPVLMVLDAILVLPPALRPILVMEDGTVIASEVNDLYLRVIHRNNRLKRMKSMQGVPGLILDLERKNLQAAVDALFMGGRRSMATARAGKRPLKSLTDIISGKEGRLRRNLLGKRVDYSGRSVIVVGPELRLHQCGLPVDLAIEIFKPFVYGRLIRLGLATNLKHARTIVDMRHPVAITALEHVIKERVVLLNRAPTLHRMGMQAFSPVLVSGKAIRLHPLVCSAFNADFDGDQMAVHLPVSIEAQVEAKALMMSINNIISPANGKISVLPTQDIVLGIYYLTIDRSGCKGEGKVFADKEDVERAYSHGVVELHSKVRMRLDGELVETTPGRVILSSVFPEWVPFSMLNKTIRKKDLARLIEMCYERAGKRTTVALLDRIKELGFEYATVSGISICIDDAVIPPDRDAIVTRAGEQVTEVEKEYSAGMLTEEERHNKIIDIWMKANDNLSRKVIEGFGILEGEINSIYAMMDSGARGSIDQVRQLAGMRGLMAKPTGEIVEIPIRSNLREGLSCFEFFLASHGARKGRADSALKTASAGYFTRRLVDACHDVTVKEVDCGTLNGRRVSSLSDRGEQILPLEERITGRVAARDVVTRTGEIIVKRNETIEKETARKISAEGITSVCIRSPVTCELDHGVCAMCYGIDLSSRKPVAVGEAVGVIAAQSIGEPGTQLTLRTFHSGGSASGEAAQGYIEAREDGVVKLEGLKYVESRDGRCVVSSRGGSVNLVSNNRILNHGEVPYGATLLVKNGDTVKAGQKIAEWDPYNMVLISTTAGNVCYRDIIPGVTISIEVDRLTGMKRKTVTSIMGSVIPRIVVGEKEYPLPVNAIIAVSEGDRVGPGEVLARIPEKVSKTSDITGGLSRVLQILELRKTEEPAILAGIDGVVLIHPPRGRLVTMELRGDGEDEVCCYTFSIERQPNVYSGDRVRAGDVLVDGIIDPEDVLRVLGQEEAASFIIDEVQKVYRGQGVEINDKHLEIVVRKMLGTVRIISPGDTGFTHGELVSKVRFFKVNNETPGRKAVAEPVLLSLTDVPLHSESWLSAASFQRTPSVLARAALEGRVDTLAGLKENVILGRVIPAGTGVRSSCNI